MMEARLYIQVSEARIKISSPGIDKAFEMSPFVAVEDVNGQKNVSAFGEAAEVERGKINISVINPFGHPRIVLGDFAVGEKLLQYAIRSAVKKRWLALAPLAIVHPERHLEGGLTQVEYRSLYEVCKGAGCRKVAVHEGLPLTMDEIRAYKFHAYL